MRFQEFAKDFAFLGCEIAAGGDPKILPFPSSPSILTVQAGEWLLKLGAVHPLVGLDKALRFRPGSPETRWRSLQRSPDVLARLGEDNVERDKQGEEGGGEERLQQTHPPSCFNRRMRNNGREPRLISAVWRGWIGGTGICSMSSATEASNGPRCDGLDRQLGAANLELRQRRPCPVLCRPVPAQVLGGRPLWRDFRRGNHGVHGTWSQRPYRLRVPCCRRQRHRSQSSVHFGRCHHRRAWYVFYQKTV